MDHWSNNPKAVALKALPGGRLRNPANLSKFLGGAETNQLPPR